MTHMECPGRRGHGPGAGHEEEPLMPDPTLDPATNDPLALALTRLAEAFTALSALTDAVDALPAEMAARARPPAGAAFGSLSEVEDILTDMAASR
jgi:hypothetical protein